MAHKVILDAMIRRADFAQQTESTYFEMSEKIKLEEIAGSSPMAKLLRKPDFQRETNHWSPDQVANLVKSFVMGELIPALILWKSESLIFVIDGGHRLSALKAWVENDYGDGSISHTFFSGNISPEQRRKAEITRRLVEKNVGRYSDLKSLSEQELASDTEKSKIHSTMFSRSLNVQWIQGSSKVAETSFFKINSQGTVLDPTEELLLRNRNKPYAISARSIVRAGSGHKYWSAFSKDTQLQIENQSQSLNDLLFQPDVKEPIKTLDLPLGGAASPVDALKMLVDIFAYVDGANDSAKKISSFDDDISGIETLEVLKRCKKVVSRMTGNEAPSLGLHPAVYFYNEQGKHSRFLFLGMLKLFSDIVQDNNKQWFVKFTNVRGKLEKILLDRKSLINQGLANINSGQRIDRVSNLIKFLIETLQKSDDISDIDMLKAMGLEGNAGNLKIIDAPIGFSTEVKSAIYLQTAISNAPRCSICQGLLHMAKSVSFDHKTKVAEGGLGVIDNGQLLHPFCNSGIKG